MKYDCKCDEPHKSVKHNKCHIVGTKNLFSVESLVPEMCVIESFLNEETETQTLNEASPRGSRRRDWVGF